MRPLLPAAFLALGQHLEVVHQGAHPGLHLFVFGAGQEADVLTQRDRHARHDDLEEAVGLERLHEEDPGEEVAAEVMDGPRSRAIAQAHNRMHAARGLLAFLLGVRG